MRTVTVVTGGAGDMGLAAAKIVGQEHLVVISDIREDRLAVAAAELEQLGIDCRAVACDITDKNSVERLVDASTQFGPVASTIHTAGVSPSMCHAEDIMKINAIGTVNLNEAFYRIAGAGFAIVNVASIAAHMLPRLFVPVQRFEYALHDEKAFIQKMMALCSLAPQSLQPGMAYSLSKTFVRWYCITQARKFGSRGARILSVSPGSIDTEMGRLEEHSGAGAMIRHAALQRFGTVDEVAALLAFCASEKAGYLTGTDILCDGGVAASMTWRDKLAIGRGQRRTGLTTVNGQ